jgi:hypothetical protein
MTMVELTGTAARIEEAIGTELTLLLLERRGGTEIKVPSRPQGTVLAEIVGEEACAALIGEIGPGKLLLPGAELRGMRARRARGYAMLRRGASLQQVALEVGCHLRTVGNWRRDLARLEPRREGPPDQLRLPFD